MGSACAQCLKTNTVSRIDEISELSINKTNARITRHIKTGYAFENVSFFITTEPLFRTKLDIVMMFIDRLQGLVDHPYIRQLGTKDKANIQKRVQEIHEMVKFEKQGDYVNMMNPFQKLQIGNLLLGKVGLLAQKQELVLSQSIEKIFHQTQRKCQNMKAPIIGLVEIHSKLGYSSAKFQKQVLKHLNDLFKGRRATFVYFTFTEERLESFINILLNPENSFSFLSNTVNSSNYF